MLSKKTLDPETRQVLLDLLDKPVRELTPDDKAFLRARIAYMTEAERKHHISIYKK